MCIDIYKYLQSNRLVGLRKCSFFLLSLIYEPRHDKTNKMAVRPAKTQISLGIRPVWSESSLPSWRKLVALATHWAHSDDSNQTRRMPRLIWVFAGRTLILLVLSCRGSYLFTTRTLFPNKTNELIVLRVAVNTVFARFGSLTENVCVHGFDCILNI